MRLRNQTTPLKLLLIAIPSLVIGLSALLGIPFAAFASDVVAINLLGFETVALVSGVMGVLVGIGRFRDGAAIGALCVAGAVAVGAIFGSLSVNNIFAGVQLRPFVIGRVLLASVVLVGSALLVIGFQRRAWLRLILGILLAGPPLALALFAATGRGERLIAKIEHVPPAISLFVGSVGFILASVLLAFGVDIIVRVFANPAGVAASGSGEQPANNDSDSSSTPAKPAATNAE